MFLATAEPLGGSARERGYDQQCLGVHGVPMKRASVRKARMSAYGYKQTFQGVSQNVRFTPESGHWLHLPPAKDPTHVFIERIESTLV